METFIWVGIFFCVTQSAMFSGLNLAFFSVTKLSLEIESKKNNLQALKVARLRQDSNFLLTTILWGNVGINVLITLLSNSVMVGAVAFIFSTFVITFLGEIIPQAYFSRHALKTASLLSPVLRFYQILLFPVAKPTAVALDKWLGPEAVQFIKEKDFRELLKIHIYSEKTDIEEIEGKGALNFLAIDDLPVVKEGETVDPNSVIQLPFTGDKPVFPEMELSATDPFIKLIQASHKKWVVITDDNGEPKATLNTSSFMQAALFGISPLNPSLYCHRPIIVKDEHVTLGEVIPTLEIQSERSDDDVIDKDIILFWGSQKRIITGSDILGRLMRGIVQNQGANFKKIIPKEA
jgi:CBS domain containing-hemolysin-like protein